MCVCVYVRVWVCACVYLSGMGMLLGCCVLLPTTVGWTGAVGRGLTTIQLEYKWMHVSVSDNIPENGQYKHTMFSNLSISSVMMYF